MADLPIRTGIAGDDLIPWSNTGDNLEGDRYFTTVTELASALATVQGVASGTAGFATGNGGVVTQITSAATTVILNKLCGQITTFALTTAAGAEEEFTITNSTVDANDVVVVSTTYAGAGTPAITVKNTAAGFFKIVITNLHAANALNAVVVINFAVIKSVVV